MQVDDAVARGARWEIDKFNDCLTASGISDAGLRKSYRTCFKLALNNDRGMVVPGALLPLQSSGTSCAAPPRTRPSGR